MQTKTLLASLAAVTVAGSAAAVSPYDVAYAPQWTYLNGGVEDERNGWIEASPDGTAWFVSGWRSYTGANFDIFGGQGNGGSWDSGYGQISGQGSILQGKSLPNITGYTDENQSYTRQSLSMQGTSAMVGWDGRNIATWAGEPLGGGGVNEGEFMTVKIDPDGAGPNTEGTTSYKTTTPFQIGFNGRTQAAVSSQTSNTVWFSGGYQSAGDVITPGDNSHGGLSPSYSPFIGKKDPTNTLSGPAKQGNTDGRSYYNALDVNESTNRVFAAGFSYVASGGTATFWDVDGDGANEYTTPGGKTVNGFGILAIYDSNTFAVVGHATVNSDYGDDWLVDVAATPDGGAVAVGYTKGTVATTGVVNPALGTDDIYVAKYDAAGTLQWDWQSASADDDRGVSVDVDPDGNIYIGSSVNLLRDNGSGTTGTNTNWKVVAGDTQVTKFDSAGNIVWNSVQDESGTMDGLFSAAVYDKHRIYVAGESNPVDGPTWTNLNGYVPSGDHRELLIHKLVPGDFNTDGVVNQADVDLADAAVDPVLAGNDTYDFDGDGNSDRKDITYWWFNILDNSPGDVDGDGDVDGVDVSAFFSGFTGPGAGPNPNVALGNYDLDLDGDGDTDGVDLASVFSAFTGPLGPANVPEPTSLALLGLGGLLAARRRRA